MAISYSSTPVAYSPAYNPLRFTATSNMTAQPNFRYKWEITVASVTTTILQSPRPDTTGILDVHRIVESYLSSNISASTQDFAQNTTSWVSYIVKCTESYGSPATDHLNTTATNIAVNAALTFKEFFSWVYTAYVIGSGAGALFLTNAPSTQKIMAGQMGWVHFYTTAVSATNARMLRLKTYDATGTLLATTDFTNPYSIASPYYFVRVPVGPAGLTVMNYPSGDPTVGCAYYTIQMVTSGGSAISELMTFEIDTKCSPYDVVRLHFLNALGGFDAYNFRMKSANNTEIQRSVFKRIPTLGDLATRGDVQFNTVTSDSVTAISDWVSDDEATWLKELFTSPEVYLEDPTSTYLEAVVIGNTSYETKNTATSRLFALTIQFSKAIDNARQRF